MAFHSQMHRKQTGYCKNLP